MQNRPISSVVFDLGGVLLEWDVDRILAGLFDDSRTRTLVKRAVFEHPDWYALDEGSLTEEEAVQRYSRRTGLPVPQIERVMQQARESLVPKPGAVELLDDLRSRGLDLYCLSNMHEKNAEYLLEREFFWDRFDGIVFSAPLRMAKPDPEIFEHLLSRYRLEPSCCAFVDDAPANVETARSLGMHGILFASIEDCRRRLDAIIARPEDRSSAR